MIVNVNEHDVALLVNELNSFIDSIVGQVLNKIKPMHPKCYSWYFGVRACRAECWDCGAIHYHRQESKVEGMRFDIYKCRECNSESGYIRTATSVIGTKLYRAFDLCETLTRSLELDPPISDGLKVEQEHVFRDRFYLRQCRTGRQVTLTSGGLIQPILPLDLPGTSYTRPD